MMTTAITDTCRKILSVADDWAHNRELYPGWLIAPKRSRDHIYACSAHWTQPVLVAIPSLKPSDAFRVLDELNWRLETSLVSFSIDLAKAIEATLETLNPFPKVRELPGATLDMSGGMLDSIPWVKVREQWARLAFAILRFHREERSQASFYKWHKRLSAIIQGNSEWASRLSYEKCLFHLAWSDHDAVRTELKTWPDEERDPIWKARRAAVFMEIGEINVAGQLAESALQGIRNQGKGPDDLASLSREGWIMLLVHALESQKWFAGEGPRTDYRGRWEYLARFRCDPWAEIEFFDEKLKHDPQLLQSTVSRQVGFQPGTYSRTFHLGGRPAVDSIVAYQYMRMTEEAPYPPFCGNATISGKSLEVVAGRFADLDPVRTHTLVCRLNSTELVDRFLTRARVAALPIEVINELLGISLVAINTSEPVAIVPESDPRDNSLIRIARRRLATGLNLLARLAIRLSSADCNRLLTHALELYRSQAIRDNVSLPKLLGSVIRSLLLVMLPEDILARLLELTSLPVPGSADFQVPHPHDWPTFLDLLPDKASGRIRPRGHLGWARLVDRLIDALKTAPAVTRGRAALWLNRLNEYECLTKAEVRRFAKALWDGTLPGNDLPTLHPYRPTAVLRLPEPANGLARTKVRTFLTTRDISRVRSNTVEPDGNELLIGTQFADGNSFLRCWLEATATVKPQTTDNAHIVWAPREIASLFSKILLWWNDEGRLLVGGSRPSSQYGQSMTTAPLQIRLGITLEVLRDIVLAKSVRRSRIAVEAIGLVKAMSEVGVATHSIQPALIKFSAADVQTAAGAIQRGLVATDENVYLQAVRGLIFWLRSQDDQRTRPLGYKLPMPPGSLLGQLGCNMASRRQPGLLVTLDALGLK